MWHGRKCLDVLAMKRREETVEEIVERAMDERNLRIEAKDENGRWSELKS